jgi:hypothetical protein
MLYERPYYYAVSHLLIGFFAAWFPIVGVIGVVYQLGQLLFNVRCFPVELRCEEGNNIYHTGMKVFEMGIGYIVGRFFKGKSKNGLNSSSINL